MLRSLNCTALMAMVLTTSAARAELMRDAVRKAPHGCIIPMPANSFYDPPEGFTSVEIPLAKRWKDGDSYHLFPLARGISRVRPGLIVTICGEIDGKRVETRTVAYSVRLTAYDDSTIVLRLRCWVPVDARLTEMRRVVLLIIAPPSFPGEEANPCPLDVHQMPVCGLLEA